MDRTVNIRNLSRSLQVALNMISSGEMNPLKLQALNC